MTETLPEMEHGWDTQVWQYPETGEPGITVQSEEITPLLEKHRRV